MTTVKVTGFKDLEAALTSLSKAAGKGVLRRALKNAATPIADAARAMAPDDAATRGYDLKNSIAVSTKLSRREAKSHRKMFRDDRAAVEMFVGAGPLPQAVFNEFGTSPFINKGKFAGTENPGMSPRPFLRPAWDAGKGKLLDDLGREMWSEFDKSAKRAASKAARQAAKG